MDKRELEMQQTWRRNFEKHVAKLTTHGDLEVLYWSQPGTNNYLCRYVFDGQRMYTSGDIGEALFELTWKANVHSFNNVSISYFDEKLRAYSDDRRDFNSVKAVKRLREWLKEIKEDGIKYDHDDMKELFNNARGCSQKWEWVEAIHDHQEFITGLEPDYWEWMYNCGDEVPSRVYGYLIGLKMASEQLRAEQPSEPLKMDLIPLPNMCPEYELIAPVTLGVSGVVKDTSHVRKKILDALISWVEDGPGFISSNDDSKTITIRVDEVKMVSAQQHKDPKAEEEEGKVQCNSSLSQG